MIQDRHHGHREIYCKQEREETFASIKDQRRCLEWRFENRGKGMSGRGCYRSKGLREDPFTFPTYFQMIQKKRTGKSYNRRWVYKSISLYVLNFS